MRRDFDFVFIYLVFHRVAVIDLNSWHLIIYFYRFITINTCNKDCNKESDFLFQGRMPPEGRVSLPACWPRL